MPVSNVDRAMAQVAVRHQDGTPVDRVLFHELEFRLGQCAFLVQHLERSQCLADVVQHRCKPDGVEIVLAITQVTPEIDRKQADVHTMLGGIGVTITDPCQPEHRIRAVDDLPYGAGHRRLHLLDVDGTPEAHIVHQ